MTAIVEEFGGQHDGSDEEAVHVQRVDNHAVHVHQVQVNDRCNEAGVTTGRIVSDAVEIVRDGDGGLAKTVKRSERVLACALLLVVLFADFMEH